MRPGLRAILAACVLTVSAAVPTAEAADPFLRRTATVEVVERVGPSVVNITTEQIVRSPNPFGSGFNDPFFDRFFSDFFERGRPRNRTRQSLGSGVLIDAEGHVITNEHVVARASRIRVSLADGREFEAQLVGADPNNDLAVLRIESEDTLPWVRPGSSDDLMVGEPVIAIGNPFGLSNTVTTGVISARNRSVNTGGRIFHGFLQTDASINPGNSGGPLLNAHGDLIGVNTAIYGNAEGIGFAIPIGVAMRVVDELIAHGEVPPVWLGLHFQDLDPTLAEALDLPPETRGVLVSRVHDRSPARKARIRRSDVLTRVDGHPVGSAREFFQYLVRSTPGQVLELELLRGREPRQARVVAEEIPERLVEDLVRGLLGLRLEPAAEGPGFVVEEVVASSAAARIGLAPGDRLLRINGRRLADEAALRRSVLDLRGRARAIVVVARGRGRYHVTIPLV